MLVLPYRTDAVALIDWLTARARGRSAEQLRNAAESPKAVEGAAAAATALGLADAEDGRLTDTGERLALASAGEREQILQRVLVRYAPYGEMLRALAERGGPAETEARWVEAWWATRGYGSSESNRREGAATFGRLADYAGLGEYVPGRRGRPTRIRWVSGVLTRESHETAGPPQSAGKRDDLPDLFSTPPAASAASPTEVRPPSGSARRSRGGEPTRPSSGRSRNDSPVNRITVPLAGEALARIEVPLRLPRIEKRRLLDLLVLLISEE